MTALPTTQGPGSDSLIAPSAGALLDRAKASAMHFYVAQVEKDGVPATQRAMYVLKVFDAQTVLDGGSVPSLAAEAALTGDTPADLARKILALAAQSRAVELQRMRVNAELAAVASSPADPTPLLRVLDRYGIDLLPA